MTIAERGNRRRDRTHHAIPLARLSPTTSVAAPPPVIQGTGALAARSATVSR
jgi:hypothetical protein